MKAVFLFFPWFLCAVYYSQCGQDQIIHETYFPHLKEGVFIDIGAHNGITFSNSYFFEKERGWKGICVEPIAEIFAQLKENRSCHCVQGCVSDFSGTEKLFRVKNGQPGYHLDMLSGLVKKYSPQHLERMQKEVAEYHGELEVVDVPCFLLNDLLKQYGLRHVHFLSVDTEGGEFDLLSKIDFAQYSFDVIAVEDNYGDDRFVPFLKEKGFALAGRIGQDLLFVHKTLRK